MNKESLLFMSSDFLKKYLAKLSDIFNSIDAKEFECFITELQGAFNRDSQIFICGNGGSAATATHFACDINKCVNYGKEKKFKLICLNDNIPTMLAYANDVSYDDIFIEQLKNFMIKDDLLICISGSGNSKNVLKAIDYANKNSVKTFGICGYSGGKLKEISQNFIVINSNDMQKIEDMHMIIFHCAVQWFIAKQE